MSYTGHMRELLRDAQQDEATRRASCAQLQALHMMQLHLMAYHRSVDVQVSQRINAKQILKTNAKVKQLSLMKVAKLELERERDELQVQVKGLHMQLGRRGGSEEAAAATAALAEEREWHQEAVNEMMEKLQAVEARLQAADAAVNVALEEEQGQHDIVVNEMWQKVQDMQTAMEEERAQHEAAISELSESLHSAENKLRGAETTAVTAALEEGQLEAEVSELSERLKAKDAAMEEERTQHEAAMSELSERQEVALSYAVTEAMEDHDIAMCEMIEQLRDTEATLEEERCEHGAVISELSEKLRALQAELDETRPAKGGVNGMKEKLQELHARAAAASSPCHRPDQTLEMRLQAAGEGEVTQYDEASKVISEAQKQADGIILEAQKEAELIVAQAHQELEAATNSGLTKPGIECLKKHPRPQTPQAKEAAAASRLKREERRRQLQKEREEAEKEEAAAKVATSLPRSLEPGGSMIKGHGGKRVDRRTSMGSPGISIHGAKRHIVGPRSLVWSPFTEETIHEDQSTHECLPGSQHGSPLQSPCHSNCSSPPTPSEQTKDHLSARGSFGCHQEDTDENYAPTVPLKTGIPLPRTPARTSKIPLPMTPRTPRTPRQFPTV